MDSAVDLIKLKEYMNENNISEQQLSKMLDISYPMVYRIFRKQRNPSGKFLNNLIKSEIPMHFFLLSMLPDGNNNHL